MSALRSPTRDQLQPASPRHDSVTRQILESDIGLESISEALEFASYLDDPEEPPSKAAQLLALMHDPSCATASLPTLMKKVGLLLPEVLDIVRKKELALAMVGSSRHVGGVLKGLGQMAQVRWKICDHCGGEGEVTDQAAYDRLKPAPGEPIPMKPCLFCDNGKQQVDPSLEAAKIFLQAHGVGGGKGAQNVINVTAQAQAGARADSGGPRKAQDAETVTSRVQSLLEGGS